MCMCTYVACMCGVKHCITARREVGMSWVASRSRRCVAYSKREDARAVMRADFTGGSWRATGGAGRGQQRPDADGWLIRSKFGSQPTFIVGVCVTRLPGTR